MQQCAHIVSNILKVINMSETLLWLFNSHDMFSCSLVRNIYASLLFILNFSSKLKKNCNMVYFFLHYDIELRLSLQKMHFYIILLVEYHCRIVAFCRVHQNLNCWASTILNIQVNFEFRLHCQYYLGVYC